MQPKNVVTSTNARSVMPTSLSVEESSSHCASYRKQGLGWGWDGTELHPIPLFCIPSHPHPTTCHSIPISSFHSKISNQFKLPSKFSGGGSNWQIDWIRILIPKEGLLKLWTIIYLFLWTMMPSSTNFFNKFAAWSLRMHFTPLNSRSTLTSVTGTPKARATVLSAEQSSKIWRHLRPFWALNFRSSLPFSLLSPVYSPQKALSSTW